MQSEWRKWNYIRTESHCKSTWTFKEEVVVQVVNFMWKLLSQRRNMDGKNQSQRRIKWKYNLPDLYREYKDYQKWFQKCHTIHLTKNNSCFAQVVREIKSHVYGKQQTSDSSWEFLRIENKQIKTVQNNSSDKLAWNYLYLCRSNKQ